MKKPLRVMKFGGTSVGDASCIARVAEIIRAASGECSVAVVVSAMGGVTNRLIEAANLARDGNEKAVFEIFAQLKRQHGTVIEELIHSVVERKCIESTLQRLFIEGERLCQDAIRLRSLTPRSLDAISGLGERLCAPLVAAALSETGVSSASLNATELVVTDSSHGRAEPFADLTRMRCQSLVAPLLKKGIVPVVTGFIGATEEGVTTTLGRGGSDYSATILAAALDADEVVIWSDVSGLLTADPKLVPQASTIAEISYREAAEMAYFGAKVLHPKTLRPVTSRGIPIWIRNTFAPADPGTRITPLGPLSAGGIKALAAINDAALITVAGSGDQAIPDALARTVATAAALHAEVLMISQSCSHNDICLVIPSALANRTVAALRQEFLKDVMNGTVENAVFDAAVSVITLVGQSMRMASENVVRALAALEKKNLNILATVQGSSDCSMSFVVPQHSLKIVLASIHRELELGSLPVNGRPVALSSQSEGCIYPSSQASAD